MLLEIAIDTALPRWTPSAFRSKMTDWSFMHLVAQGGTMVEENEGDFGPLLDRARNGDESALGELLEGNRNWLRRNALHSVGPRFARKQDASDVTQECLTAASQQIEDFRGEEVSTFRGWLRAIQRNLIRRLVRSQAAKIDQECDLPLSTHGGVPLGNDHTPLLDRVEQRESVNFLLEAIDELEESDRKLIQRKFLSDADNRATYEELAVEFDCNAAALRKRLSRLLKKIEIGITLLKEIRRCQVPALQRRMLCLQHFRGWNAEQIGESIGTTTEATNLLLAQAGRELRKFGEFSP